MKYAISGDTFLQLGCWSSHDSGHTQLQKNVIITWVQGSITKHFSLLQKMSLLFDRYYN